MNRLLIMEQCRELTHKYINLTVEVFSDESVVVSGDFLMQGEYKNIPLADNYSIRMIIPSNYPDELPTVYDESNKIPAEFEHKYSDCSLCLGIYGELMEKFSTNPTLLGFFDTAVIEYYYSVCFFSRFGDYPYGERSHGYLGVLEFYKERLSAKSIQIAFILLNYIVNPGKFQLRGHHRCPCGSNERIRDCHGPTIFKIREDARLMNFFMHDYTTLVKYFDKSYKQRAFN